MQIPHWLFQGSLLLKAVAYATIKTCCQQPFSLCKENLEMLQESGCRKRLRFQCSGVRFSFCISSPET